MTVKELKEILDRCPDDCVVMYRHNKYGRVDIDEIACTEEELPSGNKVKCLTLEASFEED